VSATAEQNCLIGGKYSAFHHSLQVFPQKKYEFNIVRAYTRLFITAAMATSARVK